MQKAYSLSELEHGSSGIVLDIHAGMNVCRRLQDIGLIKGTQVKCVLKSPFNDPSAYLIRGAVIALRTEDSSCVQIKCINNN